MKPQLTKHVWVIPEFGCGLACPGCSAAPPKAVFERVMKKTTPKTRRLSSAKLAGAIRDELRPNLDKKPIFLFTGYCDSLNLPWLNALIKTIKREEPDAEVRLVWGLYAGKNEQQITRRSQGATMFTASLDGQHVGAMAIRMGVTPEEAENEAVRRLVWAARATTKNGTQFNILTETRYQKTLPRILAKALEQLDPEKEQQERITLTRAKRFHGSISPRGWHYGKKPSEGRIVFFDGHVSDRYDYERYFK